MAGNFRHVPGVKYIAGVTFQSEYGVHEAGKVVKEAEKFQNLEVLVSSRFLWPYCPAEGYEWLPPHLFNDVQTMAEAKAALKGDESALRSTPQHHEVPETVKTAEAEAEAQVIIREAIKSPDQPGVPVAEEKKEAPKPTPQPTPRLAKKTAKKTASKES